MVPSAPGLVCAPACDARRIGSLVAVMGSNCGSAFGSARLGAVVARADSAGVAAAWYRPSGTSRDAGSGRRPLGLGFVCGSGACHGGMGLERRLPLRSVVVKTVCRANHIITSSVSAPETLNKQANKHKC